MIPPYHALKILYSRKIVTESKVFSQIPIASFFHFSSFFAPEDYSTYRPQICSTSNDSQAIRLGGGSVFLKFIYWELK